MEKRCIRLGIEMKLLKIGLYLYKLLPGILRVIVYADYIVLEIKREHLLKIILLLKNHINLQINYLSDIWCVDYPEKPERFEINYLLSSLFFNFRICIRLLIKENDFVLSISSLYKSSNWLEREIWDMYGIVFKNNKDLRRILTDYGFDGFPLRKDFPLSGFIEVRYDDCQKRVVQENLEVIQEFRGYTFKSPWEK